MRRGYRRVAAAASAAALGGAPLLLLAQSPAAAEPPALSRESGREVVFYGGGPGVPSCWSKPSVRNLTVPADSVVRFINKLNQGATLRLDGRDAGRVPRGGVRRVLFRHGPVRVEMVPDCRANVGSSYGTITIKVRKAPAATHGGTPGGGTGHPTGRSTPGTGAPSGTPGAGAPTNGGSISGGGATVDETAGPVGVAEPVAAAEPVGDTGPVGLLALIATGCVVGVSIGTIRAVITQRATRPWWA